MALKQGANPILIGASKERLKAAKLFYGSATTAAAVVTDVDSQIPQDIGSIYINNTAGILFRKIARTVPATSTDWTSIFNLTNSVTGILPVANGGTGLSTQTANAIYKGNTTSAPVVSSITDDGTTVATTEKLTITNTLASNAPTVTRLVRSEFTLNTASDSTITPNPATDSFTAVRGCLTITTGKTLAAGFAYGVQGKLIGDGATINVGSNHVAGLYAQLSLNGSTITSGHVAGLVVSGQSWPSSVNLDGIYVESGGDGKTFNAVLKAVFNGAYVFDISPESSAGNGMFATTSSTVTNIGTKGWLKVKINGVDRYIGLADGVS